jgi:hypothetical protein
MSARDELFEALTGGGWNVSPDEEAAMNRLIDEVIEDAHDREAPTSPVKAPESEETPYPGGLDLTRALRALERDLGISIFHITKVVLDPRTITVSYLDNWRGHQVVNTMELDYYIDLDA